MIKLKVRGGCGNQLFQYAAARALQCKIGGDLFIDFCSVYCARKEKPNVLWHENSLSYFKNTEYTEKSIKIRFIQKNIIRIFEKSKKFFVHNTLQEYKYERKWFPILNFFGIYYCTYGYLPFRKHFFKDTIMIGYFESHDYFSNIRKLLLKELSFENDINEANSALIDKIKNTNSVCITVRRGEFVTNSNARNNSYICNKKYFINAVEKVREVVENPVFFVFSDDIEWAKENLNLDKNICFESGNDSVYEKLRLMSSCKHFIISNSTFSWWAQYLSKNECKKVIAPSMWRKDSVPIDIYQDDWLLLDVVTGRFVDE